jgi:conjugal transfer/entry exclusion protein
MTEEAQDLAAKIAFQSEEIKNNIDKLIDRQEDLQDDILTLQRRKRDGEAIDEKQLDEFKKIQKEASRMVGTLAIRRTELLDDLPVIRTATGKLKVVTAQLENDANLIEDAKARVEKVTKSLKKAEKLIVKIIGLIAQV